MKMCLSLHLKNYKLRHNLSRENLHCQQMLSQLLKHLQLILHSNPEQQL